MIQLNKEKIIREAFNKKILRTYKKYGYISLDVLVKERYFLDKKSI